MEERLQIIKIFKIPVQVLKRIVHFINSMIKLME